jgi:hypothetical protein
VLVCESPQTRVSAGQGEALLGADDVHDALAMIVMRTGEAEVCAVGVSVSTWVRETGSTMPLRGRPVGMLWSGVAKMEAMRTGPAAGQLEALEGLRAGDFMHQVPVDIEQRGPVRLGVDDVCIPKFFVKSTGHD